jgi:Polyketide cyclase / dehydrase and lipid transport
MNDSIEIRWPNRYDPLNTPIHVRNEIDIAAPPEIVWAWLIRAHNWPTWYENSANIRFVEGVAPDIALGTRFKWKAFGVGIDSRVQEFVPFERIAWNGSALGIAVYHAWLIVRTPSGCRVITEESQRGWLARLSVMVFLNRMWKFHQIWLESLGSKAMQGKPEMLASPTLASA